MVKVIGIIENDSITGVKYGTIEVDENVSKIERAKSAYDSAVAKVQATRARKIRSEKTKNK
ncbi:MAG: hypothetical protein IJX89_03875 [Alphaproteobacteria bacterium]|nr:hypothetical protein [Alphaproteobacteria bacterium]